jgi:hypothetical protein
MNKDALLNVAKSLSESQRPHKFTMSRYVNSCGTPACAFGHYASREDLQDLCKISATGAVRYQDSGDLCDYDDSAILDHFDITGEQAEELFGPTGCGGAATVDEAVKYIESFVA